MKVRTIILLIMHLLDFLVSQESCKSETGFVEDFKSMLRMKFLGRKKKVQ